MAVRIARFDASDTCLVEAVVAHQNAVRCADSPWQPEELPEHYAAWLRTGWDGDAPIPYAGFVGDTLVASGEVTLPTYDNLHMADLGVKVTPDVRRRGYGTAMLTHLMRESRAFGRRLAGGGGWNSAATRGFAASSGFTAKIVEVSRRQNLAEADWELIQREHAKAREVASAYRVLRLPGNTPAALLPAVAEMTAAINDAPIDDLEIDDEEYSEERVARIEQNAQLTRRFYRVVAQHRLTGELAGHTVITVDKARPAWGEQDDTSVVRAHRGHRLGILLKTEMMLWLREAEPQLVNVDTWNAKSNTHMIAVNELLGYRVLGETTYYQAPL